MATGKLYVARHSVCGGKVTSEWKDYNTYPGVVDADGAFIHGFEDESVYTGDSDKNETGCFCNECDDYIEESEIIPGEEFVPDLKKVEAVIAAVKLLKEMNDVAFIAGPFSNRIDEVVFNLENEHGLLDPAPEGEVPGMVVDESLLIDDLEE